MSDTEPWGRDNLPVPFDLGSVQPWTPGQGQDTPDGGIYVGTAGAEDRYRLIRRLGRGLEGEVWEAEDLSQRPGDPCAVKLVRPPTPSESEVQQVRWLAQRQLLMPLRHPSLVGVRDMFQAWRPHPAGACSGVGPPPEPRQVYVAVMDLARGSKLAEVGAWAPMHERLRWLAQIADAVSYLHRQVPPVLHRDISPVNIVVPAVPATIVRSDLNDHGSRALLVDFGLVRVDEPDKSAVWAANLGYCAPEVLADPRRTSMASDVYSLAATACFALIGEGPLARPGDLEQRLQDALEGSADRPDQVIATLKAMMQPDPAARPPASSLAGGLLSKQTVPIEVPATVLIAPQTPTSRSSKLVPVTLAVLVVALGLGLVVALLTRPDETDSTARPTTSVGTSASATLAGPSTTAAAVPTTVVTTTTTGITDGIPQADVEAKLLTIPELKTILGSTFDDKKQEERRPPLLDPAAAELCQGIFISGQINSDGFAVFGYYDTAATEISGFRDVVAAANWMSKIREGISKCQFDERTGPRLGDEVIRISWTDGSRIYDLVLIRKGANIAQAALRIEDGLHLTKVDRMAAQLAARLP
ncbi:MAG: serine/threonine-protein kinase [Acidimicrobiales bacterium]